MDTELIELAREYFEKAGDIKHLQNEQKKITREVYNQLVKYEHFEFLSINWRALARFASKG